VLEGALVGPCVEMALARTSDGPLAGPFVGKAVSGVLEGALVGPDVTGLFVGASTVSIVEPTGASKAGRLGGNLLGRVVGISVGLKSGLVVGLSTKLIPSTKVGSEAPKTGLIVGTPVTFVEVRRKG
jgi:hypothetical protein